MRCNLQQLSDITGVGVVTLKARIDSEGLPFVYRPANRREDWVFDTVDVIEYMTGRTEVVEKLDEAKKVKLDTDRVDLALRVLKYGEESNQLIRLDDARAPFSEANAVVKSRMLALPGRMAQTLAAEADPVVVQRMLVEEVDGILRELYEHFSKAAS